MTSVKFLLYPYLTLVLAGLMSWPSALSAAEYTWDANTGEANAQDGSGTWSEGGTNWYDVVGNVNVAWPVNSTDIAIFGAGGALTDVNRTVTVSGTVSAGGLRFDPVTGGFAYILQGGTINLADNAFIDITDGATAAGVSQRLQLNSNITGSNITIRKTGETGDTLGAVQLRNAKAWTGTLTLEDITTTPNESLFVELYHGSAINSLDAVHIKTNSTLVVATADELSTNFILESLAGRGAIRMDANNTHITGDITANLDSLISLNTAGHATTLSGGINGTGRVTFGVDGKLGTYLLDGVLSNSGGITLEDSTVILAGNNTFTGGIQINEGELIVANDGALNSVTPQTVTFGTDGSRNKTLTLDGHSVAVGSLVGSGSSIKVQNGADTDATLTITGSGISFGGIIQDGDGDGILNLEYRGNATGSRYAVNGTNTFSGDVMVTQGTLIARANSQALGNGALVTVAQGARLELDQNVTISGKHLVTPYLVGAAGSNTWDGTVQVAAGATNTTLEATGTNVLTVNGEINGTNPDGQLSDVTVNGNGTVITNGSIVNARRLIKNGNGMWVINGANNFNTETAAGTDFGLSINSGTVRLGHVDALAEGNGVYNIVTFHTNTADKILQVYGVNAIVRSLFSGSGATNSIVENGSATDATLILKNPDNRTYTGVIRDGGTGKLGLTVTGGGIHSLSGQNTYSGDTTVAGGSELRLNFAATSPVAVPTDNIINNVDNNSKLVTAGGTLTVQGKADTASNSQRFNGLHVASGFSTINLANASGGNSVTLNLGAITRDQGYINFNIGAANTATTTTPNTNGILGTWATVSGTDWAMNDGAGNIVAFNGYTDVTNFGTGAGAIGPIPDNPAAHVRIVNGGVSGNVQLGSKGEATPTEIASLLMSASGPAVIEINDIDADGGQDVLNVTEGGIMLAAGAGNLTIGHVENNGGVLTTSSEDGMLVFTNHSTTSSITVNVDILDHENGPVSLVKNGAGRLVLKSGYLFGYTGNTYFNGGVVSIQSEFSLGAEPGAFEDKLFFNGGALEITETMSLSANRGIRLLEGGGTISVTSGKEVNYGGVISGVGGLTKAGAGILVLTNENNYMGDTLVAGGSLRVLHNKALGTTDGITSVTAGGAFIGLGDGVTITGETLRIRGNGDNFGALQLRGGSSAATATAATWTGDVYLDSTGATNAAHARIGVSNGGHGVLTISGVIRNGTTNTLNISASAVGGVVLLSGKNTYTGATEITRGTLRLGVDDSLPTGTILHMSIAAIADQIVFDMNGYNQTIAGLRSGTTSATLSNQRIINSGSSTSTLTIDQEISTSYKGSIKGNVAIVKDGSGTLTLDGEASASGATDYTGKTTVSGGTLALAGTQDLVGTPWIQVDEGAFFDVTARTSSYTVSNKILSGTGTFKGSYVVDGSSMIRPGGNASTATQAQAGSGFGTLTFENLTLTPVGASTDPRVLMQLGGTNSKVTDFSESSILAAVAAEPSDGLYDKLNITGNLVADDGSTIKVEFANDFVAQWGDVFNLIDWVSGQANFNGFDVNDDLDLTAMDALLANGWTFDKSLFLEHGIIYVVPEPSKALLLLFASGLLLLPRRRGRAVCRGPEASNHTPLSGVQ